MVISITGKCVCIHAFTHTYMFISSSTQTHTHAHVSLHVVTYAANASSASTGVQNLFRLDRNLPFDMSIDFFRGRQGYSKMAFMALLIVWRFQKIASQTKLESYWCPVIYREANIQISPINVKASIKRVHVSWRGWGRRVALTLIDWGHFTAEFILSPGWALSKKGRLQGRLYQTLLLYRP